MSTKKVFKSNQFYIFEVILMLIHRLFITTFIINLQAPTTYQTNHSKTYPYSMRNKF